MRRLVIVAIVALPGMLAFGGVRRFVVAQGLNLMEHMMESVMPRMMDFCFGGMSLERRESMLGHCRSMLDRMEAKYEIGA